VFEKFACPWKHSLSVEKVCKKIAIAMASLESVYHRHHFAGVLIWYDGGNVWAMLTLTGMMAKRSFQPLAPDADRSALPTHTDPRSA
jgi:hypothetical protein